MLWVTQTSYSFGVQPYPHPESLTSWGFWPFESLSTVTDGLLGSSEGLVILGAFLGVPVPWGQPSDSPFPETQVASQILPEIPR